MGGKFLLKLNIGQRPIANKYRERKMKSTLKRESNSTEIVEREALVTRLAPGRSSGVLAGALCSRSGQHRFGLAG